MTQKSAIRHAKISGTRAGRLFKMLNVLSSGNAVGRDALAKRLRVGLRTFYRDIDLLRDSGIVIDVDDSGYTLRTDLDTALDRVPFPDPELTFGDVLSLVKGRSNGHQKLRRALESLTR